MCCGPEFLWLDCRLPRYVNSVLDRQCYDLVLLEMVLIPARDSGVSFLPRRHVDWTWRLLCLLLRERCRIFSIAPVHYLTGGWHSERHSIISFIYTVISWKQWWMSSSECLVKKPIKGVPGSLHWPEWVGMKTAGHRRPPQDCHKCNCLIKNECHSLFSLYNFTSVCKYIIVWLSCLIFLVLKAVTADHRRTLLKTAGHLRMVIKVIVWS